MLRTFYGCATLSADWSGDYEEKSAGWFELFLDLIMVAACASVADALKEDVSVDGFAHFFCMSFLYVSCWQMYTLFNARYSETSLLHYAFLYLFLVGLGTMILASQPSQTFTLGFLCLRAALVSMKLSVYAALPRARCKLQIDIALQVAAMLLLVLSLCFPSSWTLPLYLAGVGLEFIVNLGVVVFRWFATTHIPINIDHMNEREGCLVMVAIGESVVSAVINSRGLTLTPRYFVAMHMSLLVIFSLAIFYFALQPPRKYHALRRSYAAGFAFSYLHFLLIPTLLVVGVGTKLVSHALLAGAPLDTGAVWLFFGAISAAMAQMLVIRLLHFGGRQPSAQDPPCVKRIKYAWWGLFVVWPILFLLAAAALTRDTSTVDPLVALGVADAAVFVWLLSETAIMHALATSGHGHIDGLLVEGAPLMQPAMLRTFRSQPRLSADWSGDYEEKSAEWFELFLDLVMVAACANVAEKLKDEFTADGLVAFILICCLYVSSWHAYTHFHGRFSESSLVHYVFLYLLLVGLGSMVLSSEPGPRFSVGLLGVRVALLLMNGAVYRALPASRKRLGVEMVILLGSCLALGLAIAWPAFTTQCYVAMLVLEIPIQLEIRVRHWFVAPENGIPINVEHVHDREGSLVLVALGEAVVSTVVNSRHFRGPLPARFYVLMQLSLLVTFALALFYFSLPPPRETHAVQRSVRRASCFALLHVLLLPTILALGVSYKFAADAVLGDRPLEPQYVYLLFGTMALIMLFVFLLRWLHFWGVQPASDHPILIKRVMFAWWVLMTIWPLLPIAAAFVLVTADGVDPLVALATAAVCVVVWVLSETAVMNHLALLGDDRQVGDLTSLGLVDGAVLIVGDGNFSYAAAFVRNLHPSVEVVATSLDTAEELARMYPGSTEKLTELRRPNVTVLHDFNATKLETYGHLLGTRAFDRIVFNFPHYAEGGNKRNKIHKHRQLLTQFFTSCPHVLAPDGQVWVTLCAGQGGTPAETIVRAFGDTWQVASCAATAGFMLYHVHETPVDALFELGYNSVGHRLQEKAFRTAAALTHVFVLESLGETAFFPLTWSRDISFWINDGFSEAKLLPVLQTIFGPRVTINFEKIDEYVNEAGRQAYGYRLTLSSSTMSLSKEYINSKCDEVVDALDVHVW
ncbi:hypothetical protein ACHHYP_03698 [Achlya hypogyna]|uniref:FDX-ACB domain-containing protein n=1 Tax=Achlya hypogyna TaxID=1202772 RepID=A0A1V9Z372_ACHHY|nr:hypothetical protein ACHHYP_03698 [Achlya hypogyna]